MKHRVVYHLKDRSAVKATPVNAYVSIRGRQLKLATGITIEPGKWDAARQRAKRGTTHEALINRRLDAMSLRVVTLIMNLEHEGREPTPQLVAERFRADERKAQAPQDLFSVYDDFLKESESRLRPRSVQRHRTAIAHLRSFEKATGASVRFDRIDAIFFDRLVRHLIVGSNLTSVSAWNVVKPLRAFLRWAHESGITTNDEYARYTQRRIPKGQQSRKPYVTSSELEALLSLDLTDNPRLERVRDLFVFQMHTGLRFGDLQSLRSEHVVGDAIHLVTGKNRKSITVPMLPVASDIWRKYGGRLPRISNQKQNDYLKELARAADITAPVLTVDFKGTERVEKVVEKCELIGTHSAKRSFVTIMRQRGVSVEAICKITGNDRRTIETYLVDTEEDAVSEVRAAFA